MGDGLSRNDGKFFFQGSDAMVGDVFAPLGPPLLPWEYRTGRGQDKYDIRTDIATTRLNWPSGPIRLKYVNIAGKECNGEQHSGLQVWRKA